jgi:hypothetical protein
VPYPELAPGWVADPVGVASPFGNRLNVTLLQCKIACATSQALGTGCTSFFFDGGQSRCFLKKGESPDCQAPGLVAMCVGINYTNVPEAAFGPTSAPHCRAARPGSAARLRHRLLHPLLCRRRARASAALLRVAALVRRKPWRQR